MKKLIAILLCAVLMICGMTACKSSDENKIETAVTAEDIDLVPGDTGTLSVQLVGAGDLDKYGNGKLGGFQFKVYYDPAAIKLVDAVLTTDTIATQSNSWSIDYSDKEDGSAMVMILDNNLIGLAADTVPLVDLMIQAVDGASGETQVKFEIVNICDPKGEDEVRDAISDGAATVTIG